MMTQLSSTVNTSELKNLLKESDKEGIANFVHERFKERYIDPINSLDSKEKNGFSTMAVCCLMIESLESFKNGWATTNRKSELAFKQFLTSEKEFVAFKDYASQFYKHVRCGILHQSETTSGWKIRRDNDIFNPTTKTINATKFLKGLEKTLDGYVQKLKEDEWDSFYWDNLRRKLREVIKNCG